MLAGVDEEDLARLATAFGLGRIHASTYLTTGSRNHNWRLSTDAGDFALKQLLDVPPGDARRSAWAAAALHHRGLPICPPALTTDADPVLELAGRAYCLLPWIDGHHPAGHELSLTHAAGLGAVVGRIHQALNDPATGLPPVSAAPPEDATTVEDAIAQARRLQQTAVDAGSDFDRVVTKTLDQRIALLMEYAWARPSERVPHGPYEWTHGDLQHRNVLWRDDQIVAVLDWDHLRPRPLASEVARTAAVQFAADGELDLNRIAAFADGYRTVIPLDAHELADGVHRLWWNRLTDYWHLVYRYDRADYRCDELFLPREAVLRFWTTRYADVISAFTGFPA